MKAILLVSYIFFFIYLTETSKHFTVKHRHQDDIIPNKTASQLDSFKYAGVQNNKEVTKLLDDILKDYNKFLHPKFGSQKKTRVYIDIFVRTMGPISEMTDTFTFDCYFRQTWRDTRLKFKNNTHQTLSLGMSMLDKVWRPDVYFRNGRDSFLHKFTTPNRLVRLSHDGRILYSSRLTIKAKVRMNLDRFPLDRQVCKLIIGSFAYDSKQLILKWKRNEETKGVNFDIQSLKELPQFELTGYQLLNNTIIQENKNFSTLEVRFYLSRHIGYYLINYYVPCTLIVLLSWISLFLNREATGDRIALGATSFLTMTLISLDSKADSPKVNYPTALDMYISMCYVALFVCIIEFTAVHCTTKYHTDDQDLQKERIRSLINNLPKGNGMGSRHHNRPGQKKEPTNETLRAGLSSLIKNNILLDTVLEDEEAKKLTTFNRRLKKSGKKKLSRRDGGRYSIYHKASKTPPLNHRKISSNTSCPTNYTISIDKFRKDSIGWSVYHWLINMNVKEDPLGIHKNSSSSIDKVCRILLPILFALSIAVYYHIYVSKPYGFESEDIILLKTTE
uniref:Neur_chan_LBD domain-containing protein n=1 Tax=Rhabditophanes sp. KR3021 TaxID=114890 RepID=A0AC35UGC1_9BILA